MVKGIKTIKIEVKGQILITKKINDDRVKVTLANVNQSCILLMTEFKNGRFAKMADFFN